MTIIDCCISLKMIKKNLVVLGVVDMRQLRLNHKDLDLFTIYFLAKPIKGKLGFILEIMKKIARWRHKSEISKRNVKTMISPLLFRL